jgi:hypothetical protein
MPGTSEVYRRSNGATTLGSMLLLDLAGDAAHAHRNADHILGRELLRLAGDARPWLKLTAGRDETQERHVTVKARSVAPRWPGNRVAASRASGTGHRRCMQDAVGLHRTSRDLIQTARRPDQAQSQVTDATRTESGFHTAVKGEAAGHRNERSVKPSASPSQVRILDLPPLERPHSDVLRLDTGPATTSGNGPWPGCSQPCGLPLWCCEVPLCPLDSSGCFQLCADI